jgi:hypothetical protein
MPQQWGHHIGRKASSAGQRVRTGDCEPVDVMVDAQADAQWSGEVEKLWRPK